LFCVEKKYRDFLSSLNFKLVYLKIDHDTAVKRIINRNNHFMPISLLKSQIEILEEPKKL
jgi:Gluconate kinase